MACRQSKSFALFDLPEELLAHIFRLLSAQDRNNLPLVCRAWRAGARADPTLCAAALQIDVPAVAAALDADEQRDLCWEHLACRAHRCEQIVLRGPGVGLPVTMERHAELLRCLPRHLPALHLHGCVSVARLSERFVALRRLCIDRPSFNAAMAATLTALTALCALKLGDLQGFSPQGSADALCTQLAQCSRLRSLSLSAEVGRERRAMALSPATLTPLQLTRLHLNGSVRAACSHHWEGLPTRDGAIHVEPVPAFVTLHRGLTHLACLRDLALEGELSRLPADLWRCSTLTRLVLRNAEDADTPEFGEPQPLQLPHNTHLPALHHLHIEGCCLLDRERVDQGGEEGEEGGGGAWTSMHVVASLTQLTFLRLARMEWYEEEEDMLGMLSTLHALRHLDVTGAQLNETEVRSPLEALTTLAALTALILDGCGLTELPADGPYAALEVLSASGNCFTECPGRVLLERCPRLHTLDLSNWPKWERPISKKLVALARGLDVLYISPSVNELRHAAGGEEWLSELEQAAMHYSRCRPWTVLEAVGFERRLARAVDALRKLMAIAAAGRHGAGGAGNAPGAADVPGAARVGAVWSGRGLRLELRSTLAQDAEAAARAAADRDF